jgi:hypothetical protein
MPYGRSHWPIFPPNGSRAAPAFRDTFRLDLVTKNLVTVRLRFSSATKTGIS